MTLSFVLRRERQLWSLAESFVDRLRKLDKRVNKAPPCHLDDAGLPLCH